MDGKNGGKLLLNPVNKQIREVSDPQEFRVLIRRGWEVVTPRNYHSRKSLKKELLQAAVRG